MVMGGGLGARGVGAAGVGDEHPMTTRVVIARTIMVFMGISF